MTELKQFVIYLTEEEKNKILHDIPLCYPNISASEFGKKALQQYTEIRIALKDKPYGSIYTIRK